jgi:uncharacterized protein YbjQ (UPF0145 family)
MKKLLILALILTTMGSCNPKMIRSSFVIDYRPFAGDGFFITESNSVNFKYQPIGSVSTVFITGVSDKKSLTQKNYDSVYSSSSNNITYATPEGVLEALCEKCKSLGANGVINFRITKYEVNHRLTWEASGMAIKTIE